MRPRRARARFATRPMLKPHSDADAVPSAFRARRCRDAELIGATFGIERKQRLDDDAVGRTCWQGIRQQEKPSEAG
jgi:hypothetical protein